MLQFRPTLQTFEERLAPAVLFFSKMAWNSVSAIVLPPPGGGETTTPPAPPAPLPPPPPPPVLPGTGGM